MCSCGEGAWLLRIMLLYQLAACFTWFFVFCVLIVVWLMDERQRAISAFSSLLPRKVPLFRFGTVLVQTLACYTCMLGGLYVIGVYLLVGSKLKKLLSYVHVCSFVYYTNFNNFILLRKVKLYLNVNSLLSRRLKFTALSLIDFANPNCSSFANFANIFFYTTAFFLDKALHCLPTGCMFLFIKV